jgi:hypothetical protein
MNLDKIPEIAKHKTEHGFLVYGIAEGETCVRLWNPEFANNNLTAAQKRLDPNFPCIHKVQVVDPFTSKLVRIKPIWVRSPAKINFARYAVDYANSKT